MNNDQPLPTRPVPVPGSYPCAAQPPQGDLNVWPGKPGLVSCTVLCLTLVIATSACGSNHSAPSTSVATAIARGHLPTKTPTASPLPSSPSVGYQTAWGPHAATGRYSVILDATHTFIPSAISPDDTMLLGNEKIASSNPTPTAPAYTFQGGYYNLATKHFTAIGVSDAQCCMSDGRFLVAEDTDCLGCTGSPLHELYWAYDLQTGHLRLVAKAGAYQGVYGNWLSHGLLILQSGVGFLVANLAAGSLAPLTQSSTATGEFIQVDDFAWPYLLYEVTPTPNGGAPATPPPSTIRVYNFSTHQDAHLSALEAFRAAFPGESEGYTIGGDTLYVSVFSGQTYDSPYTGTTALYMLAHVLSGGTQRQLLATFTGVAAYDFIAGDTLYVSVTFGQSLVGVMLNSGLTTTLYALAHVLSGGSKPQLLATLTGTNGDITGANARVIVLQGQVWDSTANQAVDLTAVWDLALHTLVTFPTFTGDMAGVGFFIKLTGTDLAVLQGNETNETVLVFDTSTLPTTPTGG